MREAVSREASVYVGLDEAHLFPQTVSREVSVFVGQGFTNHFPEVISRECTVMNPTTEAPSAITNFTLSVSSTGERATLSWSNYNQLAQLDLTRYDIYRADHAFTDVSSMTPYTNVFAGTFSLTLDGLPAWQDHFFAVVPVDDLGGYLSQVVFKSAYALGGDLVSRESSIFNGSPEPTYGEVVSRECTVMNPTAEAPSAITNFTLSVSSTGERATLSWSNYNELAQLDFARYDIYRADHAFTDVSSMTPYTNVSAGTFSLTLDGLPVWQDHFFAVVPVDDLGGYLPQVIFKSAYVLSGELVSRECSIFNGSPEPTYNEAISREASFFVPDDAVPAPVTGVGSGFSAATSTGAYQAVELAWPNYNEMAQLDVIRYRIYVWDSYFDDVTDMTPFKLIGAGRLAYTLSGLDSGGIYYIAVVAEDAGGHFNPAVRSVSAQASVGGVSAVRNLAAQGGRDFLTYTWDPPAEGLNFLDHYEIYFGGSAHSERLLNNVTSYAVSNLLAAHAYSFRIVAVDVFDFDKGSSTALGVTWLANPTNLSLTARGGDVVLEWPASEPQQFVRRYEIFRSSAPISDRTGLRAMQTVPSPSATLGPLSDVQNDYFAVATVNVSEGSDPLVSSIQVNKQSQTVTFSPVIPGPRQIPLSATASSGLPITFSVSPSQTAQIVGSNTLSVLRGGPVAITARQDGNAAYWPAEASQTVRLPPIIASFTANGAEITNGLILVRDSVLQVIALDAQGMDSAQFSIRAVGATNWSELTSVLPVSTLSSGDYELQVRVTAAGTNTAVRTNTVKLDLQPILSMALGELLTEGMTLNGTVSIQSPRDTDLSVTLGSSNPSQVRVDSPVVIPAGQTNVAFSIHGRQDETIEPDTTMRITASAPGAVGVEQVVMLTDDDWPTLNLTLSRTLVPESAGPNAVVARLTRTPITSEPLEVWLTNSASTAAIVPVRVSIPADERFVEFPIGVVNDALLDGTQVATLTAEVELSPHGVIAQTSAQLEVGDDEGPTLELRTDRSWLFEGEPNSMSVIRHGGPTHQSLQVTLNIDYPTNLLVPATVTLASNQTQTVVSIYAPNNGAPTGSRTVMVTASANTNYGPGQLALVVTDEIKPDLLISDLAVPLDVEADATFDVSYHLQNQGSGISTSSVMQRVFLSKDTVPGDDILLAQETVPSPLAVGANRLQTENARAPQEPGDYWLFVVADAAQAQDELVEWNNIQISSQPITVRTPWTVTVATDAEFVPVDTPIRFYGSAIREGGSKVPFVTIHIHLRMGVTERILSALTDASGDYELLWQPLPGEGGDYEVGACYPGIQTAPTQDLFTILALKSDVPKSAVELIEGGSIGFTGTVHNTTIYDLTGLKMVATNLSDGLTVNLSLPGSNLTADASLSVGVSISASNGIHGAKSFTLRLTSDQGVTLTIPVQVNVRQLLPDLTMDPDRLKASVLRGGSKIVNFTLQNKGGLATGDIELLLPDFAWMKPASPGKIPSIQPDGSATVSLILQPSTNVALTLYTGHMVLAPANGSSRNLPFDFRVVSDQAGDLQVRVTDEYTYFTAEAPAVTGAVVIVRDAVTSEDIAQQEIGTNGLVQFNGLLEGWYTVEVTVPKHTRTLKNILVQAGELNRMELFTSLELVTYKWTVEEVEIEDRYRITVESTYEVNVPAPVVTVSPGQLEVGDLTQLGQTKVVNFTIENHGFIAADHGAFSFGSHPYYDVKPIIEDIGLIPAKSSIIVPVVVTRIGMLASGGSGGGGSSGGGGVSASVPCSMSGVLEYDYICGVLVPKWVPVPVSGVQGDCGGGGGGGGSWSSDPVPGGGGGGPSGNPVSYTQPTPCDCSLWDDNCLDFQIGIDLKALNEAIETAVKTLLGPSPFFHVFKTEIKPVIKGEMCSCCTDGQLSWSAMGDASLEITFDVGFGPGVSLPKITLGETSEWGGIEIEANALAGARTLLKGKISIIGERDCDGESSLCGSGEISGELTLGASVRGKASAKAKDILEIMEGEVVGNLAISGKIEVTAKVCDNEPLQIKGCASASADYFLNGTLKSQSGPPFEERSFSFGTNMLLLSGCISNQPAPSPAPRQAAPQMASAPSDSYPVILEIPQEDLWLSDQEAFDLLHVPSQSAGVCAQVRIRIDQEAVMTRSAFRATLELENKQDAASLSQVGFDLDVRDPQGQVAGDRFNVRVTKLDGLDAIDGTGTIAALSSGTAQWTLIPRDSAAPDSNTVYTIGGTIHYVQEGLTLSIPVVPVAITVRPDAALYLKYFHQRDVVSDDPHSDPVEAKEPFALAVVVENRGAGIARKLTIASVQPKIVDNEKGLLIDFEIIGTEMAGQPTLPSLIADFGTINPGEKKVATWWLTASLHGFFKDYSATFEHLDGFGDPRISLMKSVEIYEMIRMIEALGAQDDGQPDFLTNEQPDPADYPVADTLHLSNGSVTNVVFLGAGATSVQTTNAMTFALTLTSGSQTGWTYLRVPDPANGAFRLVGVTRSDGLVLPVGTNVWTTDRTFIGMGRRPVYENFLHLADFDSTGSYTLHYEGISQDITPPQSAISPLPAASGAFFPVRWSGSDDVALATYDIFVSTDGGPWTLWQDDVTRVSAMYQGEANHTYAFYSRAVDTAGNIEIKSPAQEAVTVTSIINQPPIITGLVSTNMAEGSTLAYQVFATDPDGGSERLQYTVASDRFGVSVSSNGIIRWETSELDGARTVQIMVSVMDGGIPVGITSSWFTVTVDEVNAAPQLAPIEPKTAQAGQGFIARAQAADSDLPAQGINYRLGADTPTGMTINSSTGLIEWTPSTNLLGQSVLVTVIADDSGTPSASGETTFTVTVVEPVIDVMTPPEIRITTLDDIVAYSTPSYDISGTNNAYVVGTMFWTNAATRSGSGLAVNGSQFTVSNIALGVGHNAITVSGTNTYGRVASDSVTITRQTRMPNEAFWWYQRDILAEEGRDYAAINSGQLKWVATQAYQEFQAKLPGGAGSNLTALVNGFIHSNNYIVVNQGQLKAVAKPFYDRLWELGLTNAYPAGVTNRYPWFTNTPSDYNPSNIGQLKYLFSFKLE